MMTTWRKEIKLEMENRGESWSDIESITLSEEELDIEFDDGFGRPEGLPFTVWSKKFVYFPVTYDGEESVGCVSRHPDGIPTEHIGKW